jgi:hypothetical protein
MQERVRPLSHDEKKAAEAAFRGAPFDPKWSEAARRIYLGISTAVANRRQNAFENINFPKAKAAGKTPATATKPRSRVKTSLW